MIKIAIAFVCGLMVGSCGGVVCAALCAISSKNNGEND